MRQNLEHNKTIWKRLDNLSNLFGEYISQDITVRKSSS
jgi:hypothetical protein